MNKKIILSLAIIGVVAAIAIGGTVAYFSDTETSTGNTFTAGSIDLKIDNHSFYNGEPSPDTSWGLDDLTNHLFFNFTDLKPGDWGEDTVSIHVNDNNAWACVTFKNLVDHENGCTEPESEVDGTCGEDQPGELSSELNFFFWADVCNGEINQNYPNAFPGDNIYQPECDTPLMEGPAPANNLVPGPTTYTLADSEGGVFPEELLDNDGALIGGNNYYIGKVWCFGNLGVNFENDEFICDGSSVTNISQSDSLTGDIEFYAVQSRNNSQFTCSSIGH